MLVLCYSKIENTYFKILAEFLFLNFDLLSLLQYKYSGNFQFISELVSSWIRIQLCGSGFETLI